MWQYLGSSQRQRQRALCSGGQGDSETQYRPTCVGREGEKATDFVCLSVCLFVCLFVCLLCLCLFVPVIDCGALATPSNGEKVQETGTTWKRKVVFRCTKRRYVLSGTRVRTCLPSGKWSGSTTYCRGEKLVVQRTRVTAEVRS